MSAEPVYTIERPLAGRYALVTGASRRIGRQIAIGLARAGADVAVHARASKAEIEETARLVRSCGVRAEVVYGDVSDPDDAARVPAERVEPSRRGRRAVDHHAAIVYFEIF